MVDSLRVKGNEIAEEVAVKLRLGLYETGHSARHTSEYIDGI